MPNTSTNYSSKKIDPKAMVETMILEGMAEDNVPAWKKPWLFSGYDKAFKGNAYHGINMIITAVARRAFGFESHVWLTDTKIQALNGKEFDEKTKKFKKVRDTDKFYYKKAGYNKRWVPIMFYSQIEKKDKTTGQPILDRNGNPETFPFLTYTKVYNASDVAGLENVLTDLEPAQRVLSDVDSKDALTIEKELLSLLKNPPKVVHNADHASYSPATDTIYMPPVSTFSSKEAYISSFAHELAHATGHETRMNRKGCKADVFNEDVYSYGEEELTAEFIAALICAKLGIDNVFENSVAYCKAWYKSIDENRGMLFSAIKNAGKGYDYLFGTDEDAATELGTQTENSLLA